MAKIMTDSKHYTDIATAIREKTGSTEPMKPEEMPGQIGSIKSYSEGYEQGKIDADITKYTSVLRFNKAVFPDGYELTANCDNMIQLPQFQGATGIRKATLYLPLNKAIDGSNCIYANATIEEVVFPNGVKLSTANYFATNCTQLVSVFGAMDVTGVENENMFTGCTNLVDVEFVPQTITHNKIFNKSSELSDASTQSIVDGLADLTGATAQTLTLHKDVYDKLTDAQKATIAAKNWEVKY